MRSFSIASCLLFSCVCVAAAQFPAPPRLQTVSPVTVGLWLELGPQWMQVNERTQQSFSGPSGVYVELSRHRLHPALEVRGRSSSDVLAGTLTGPRVSWRNGPWIAFASALFGPNYYTQATATTRLQGVTSEVAGGVEVMNSTHPAWGFRMEVETGTFSALRSAHPTSVSVGAVLRLPR